MCSTPSLKFSCYNCRGLNIYRDINSVKNFTVKALSEFSDIICLQETWLYHQDLKQLNGFLPGYYGTGESTSDASQGPLRGHASGGVAILWKKNLSKSIKPLNLGLDWLCGISLEIDDAIFYVLCIYMPCQSMHNLEEFLAKCGTLISVIESLDSPNVLILGDFNSNISNHSSLFGRHLREFCSDNNILLSSELKLPRDSYTYISDIWGSTSWLDHCLSTEFVNSQIHDFVIRYDLSSEDHIPFSLNIDISAIPVIQPISSGIHSRVNWARLSPDELLSYGASTSALLEKIELPHLALTCAEHACTESSHFTHLAAYYDQIVNSIVESISNLSFVKGRGRKGRPGWNSSVNEHRQNSIQAHHEWVAGGRPQSGPLIEKKRLMHRVYKNAVRQVKREEDTKISDAFAEKLLLNPSKLFWKDVKRVSNTYLVSNVIEGCDTPDDICSLWKNHYCDIYNCLDSSAEALSFNDLAFVPITMDELMKGFDKLKEDKAPGPDGIPVEGIKYADPKLLCQILLCFNAFLMHGFLPESFMCSSITPVIKDNKGNIASISNYRPIAVASVISKLFEFVILSRLHFITTTDNQFGFKQGLGTDVCIYSMKETIARLDRLGSTSFVCFLDASKAFDRVNHSRLFAKLHDKGVPNYIIRVLKFWYQNQRLHVKWSDSKSESFRSSNGIKQGGVLSPLLFCLYLDELSENLSRLNVGPAVGERRLNHFMYADDIALLAISVRGLQKLIDMCTSYGLKFDIKFNPGKTKLLIFRSKKFNDIIFPHIYMNGDLINEVSKVKYLGHWMCNDLSDDCDILNRMRDIYAQGNGIIRKFHMCSWATKIRLFKAYIYQVYCCHLWYRYKKESMHKLKVAYNNIFRVLLKVPRMNDGINNSIRALFVRCHVQTLFERLRWSQARFMERLICSQNTIVNNLILRCDTLHLSPIWFHWLHSVMSIYRQC